MFSMLLTSCGVGVNNLKRLPYHATAVGDEVMLSTDASIYDCEVRDTFGSFWGTKPVSRQCLTSNLDVNQRMHVTGSIPAGTKFIVSRIKYINGIDNTWYEIYLKNSKYDFDLMVDDLFFPHLLNIPRER